MYRSTVLIISDNTEFCQDVAGHWRGQPNSPTFTLKESDLCGQLQGESFDLAVVGGLNPKALRSVLAALKVPAKPVIHVSRLNGSSPTGSGIVTLPEISGWPELLVTIASQILQCQRATADLQYLAETRAELECQASLGRYMLAARHNLNNALTSILGNSELILLDEQALSPELRTQVETIRNMGMRMNEIMQRFSSLQKEIQLVEQQIRTKRIDSASA